MMKMWIGILSLVALHLTVVNGNLMQICEGSRFHLHCPDNATISITSAIYGRFSTRICKKNPMKITNCTSFKASREIKKTCEGRSDCTLSVSNSRFGNPCYRTTKYLSLVYECNQPAIPPAPTHLEIHKTDGVTADFVFFMPKRWHRPVSTFDIQLTDKVTGSKNKFQTNSYFYKFVELKLNREYEVKVRAVTSAGYGNFSAPMSFKTLSSSVSTLCETHWKRYNLYCFFYETTQLNWNSARSSCQARGGELMSIWNSGEQKFIDKEFLLQGYSYIGLNDIVSERRFVWSDGTTFRSRSYKNFLRNNRNSRNYDCVAMIRRSGRGYWMYVPCYWKIRSFCKKAASVEHLHKPFITKTKNPMDSLLHIMCVASAPHFVSQYTWLKDSKVFAQGINASMTLNETDVGDYVCEVKYNHNHTISTDTMKITPKELLQSDWSEWKVVVPCHTINKTSVRWLKRECIKSRPETNQEHHPCEGESTKSEPCFTVQGRPLTVGKTSTAAGKFTLKNLTTNGTAISNEELQKILTAQGIVYNDLKQYVNDFISIIYTQLDETFVQEITKMTVGSLNVEYVVTLTDSKRPLRQSDLSIFDVADSYLNTSHFSAELLSGSVSLTADDGIKHTTSKHKTPSITTTRVTTTNTSTSTNATSSKPLVNRLKVAIPSPKKDNGGHTRETQIAVGCVVGLLCFLAVIVIVAVKKNRRNRKTKKDVDRSNDGNHNTSVGYNRHFDGGNNENPIVNELKPQ